MSRSSSPSAALWLAVTAAFLTFAGCIAFTDTSPIDEPARDTSTDSADGGGNGDDADAVDDAPSDATPDSRADVGESDAGVDSGPMPTNPADPCAPDGYPWCDGSGVGAVVCDAGPKLVNCPFGCSDGACLDECSQTNGCSADGMGLVECVDGVARDDGDCSEGFSCVDGGCRRSDVCEAETSACDPRRDIVLCDTTGAESVVVPCSDSDPCRLVWPDADLDGWGDATASPRHACGVPEGTAENNDDCDDDVASDESTPCAGWVIVDGGEFVMGTPEGEVDPRPELETQQLVRLTRQLLVLSTEVTQAMWSDATTAVSNPSAHAGCDDCPVETINWFEALRFANDLSADHGLTSCYALRECSGTYGSGCDDGEQFCGGLFCDGVEFLVECTGYRLPTEAEWEYLARGGTTTPYHGLLDDVAWYRNTVDEPFKSQPVGQLEPNAFGLYDMHGNVSEWVEDALRAYEGDTETAVVDPVVGRDADAISTRAVRGQRGGTFKAVASAVRSAARGGTEPDSRADTSGLRLVRDLGPASR